MLCTCQRCLLILHSQGSTDFVDLLSPLLEYHFFSNKHGEKGVVMRNTNNLNQLIQQYSVRRPLSALLSSHTLGYDA